MTKGEVAFFVLTSIAWTAAGALFVVALAQASFVVWVALFAAFVVALLGMFLLVWMDSRKTETNGKSN